MYNPKKLNVKLNQIINSMNKLLLLLVVIGFSISTYAQKTVTGQVKDNETNEVLPGVNVNVKNSTKGDASDFDGNYSISGVDDDAILVFSYVGYKTLEIAARNQSVINVTLIVDAQLMEEVVVTALDIQRDKASLGYSVKQLEPVEFDVAQENNVINSLTGKVAGLQITQGNTGVDGSSRVLLRGVSTIEGSNRPLVVVDGIPAFSGGGGGSQWGGNDRGDALSDINPDDVATITVLKGAGAAAAYGSLGMHGVILITTKSGVNKAGIGITVSSTLTMTEIALAPELQNEYGTGAFGGFAPINSDGRPVLDYPFSWSWGPKMEGQDYTNWLGVQDTFSPQGDSYEQFYQTGTSYVNSVAFQGTTDNSSFRFSFTDQDSEGIVPDNTIGKQTVNFRATSNLTDKFKLDGKVTYIKSKVRNQPFLGEAGANTSLQLGLMPRDIRLEDVRNNTVDADGNEIKWNLDNTFDNPYWVLDNMYNEDNKDRFQGSFSAKLDINENFYITGKTGLDYLIRDYTQHAARGAQAQYNGLGGYSNSNDKNGIWNSDLMATYAVDFSGFNVTASLGTNYRKEFGKSIGVSGNDEKTPNFYNVSNYINSFGSDYESEKAVYSFYGLGQFSYAGILYLDATIRNDNSSALPKDNDSYWYHSENVSFLFTKLFGITSNTFNIGKLRGSYSRVGNDTGPYRTQSVYNIDQTKTLPYTVGSIPGSLPNSTLKPEISDSWEVGTELGFFNNRIHLDFTYYQTLTKDQIMAVPISGSTGYNSKVVNAGSIESKGYEVQLDFVPIETESFTWDLGLTWTKSNSIVESLNESLETIVLNTLTFGEISVEARPGEEFGSIYGFEYLRDNFGRKLITDEGFAQKGERTNFGSMNPDYYGGITNNFRYKDFSLRTLISYQVGGEFYSWGRGYRMIWGTDQRSLEGRETGINEIGINENTGFENQAVIPAMLKNYTNIFVDHIGTDLILDATNVKLKEIVLTYDFPRKFLDHSFIQDLSVSAIGRDLFYIYNAAGDIDPFSSFSSGPTGTALEHSSLPSTRSYGMNVKINF